MYGNTPFEANNVFGGGGFMPSQATQTTDLSFSPAKNRDAQVLLPLTVKQISEAYEASDDKKNFLIDGVDVNNVKLVGMLCEMTDRVNEVTFVVDDGTGRIDCHKWAGEAADAKELEILQNGMYIKVHGHLRGFGGKRQLMVYSVRPIIEYDEVASHFVECIYVHCHNTRLQSAAQLPGLVPSAAVNTPLKNYQPTPANQASVEYKLDGVSGISKLVLDYLQQPSCIISEKGVHRDELKQQLQIPENQLLEAIEDLNSEGLIYTTINDYHYKSILNG